MQILAEKQIFLENFPQISVSMSSAHVRYISLAFVVVVPENGIADWEKS